MKPSHPVLEAALSCHDWLVGLRQQLHQLPELSYREQATAECIKTELRAMGVPLEAVGEHGVVATVTGQQSSARVALRVDLDALPIQEQNGSGLRPRSGTPQRLSRSETAPTTGGNAFQEYASAPKPPLNSVPPHQAVHPHP